MSGTNSPYTLLGMVIEAATETQLAEAYRTNIYEPLGITSTFLDCYEEPVIDIVHGYTGAGDEMADVTILHESVGWSAGGLVSTAAELTTFGRGLFGGALFDNPETLAAMTTPAPASANGLGVLLTGDYMGHAGGIAGFRSVLNYVPKMDTGIVMLYNHDGADPEQSDVGSGIMDRCPEYSCKQRCLSRHSDRPSLPAPTSSEHSTRG